MRIKRDIQPREPDAYDNAEFAALNKTKRYRIIVPSDEGQDGQSGRPAIDHAKATSRPGNGGERRRCMDEDSEEHAGSESLADCPEPTSPAAGGKAKRTMAKRPGRAATPRGHFSSVEEDIAEIERDFEIREEIERIQVAYREKQQNCQEQAQVEEENRIDLHGSPKEMERLYYRSLAKDLKIERHNHRLEGQSENGKDQSNAAISDDDELPELRSVAIAQDSEDSCDFDPDAYRYEDFTGHFFWQVTNPAPPDHRRKYPSPDKQVVVIPRWIGRITRNWAERAILAQLVYYFQVSRRDNKIRARRRLGGQLWVAKDDREMAAETMLTRRLVKKCRRRLVRRKLLIVEHHRFPVKRDGMIYMLKVCHYRINWDVMHDMYMAGGGDFADLEDAETAWALKSALKRGQEEVADDQDEDYDEDD
jgi:hypothetical protein